MAKKVQGKVRGVVVKAVVVAKKMVQPIAVFDAIRFGLLLQRGVVVLGHGLNARQAIADARRDGYIPVIRPGRIELY